MPTIFSHIAMAAVAAWGAASLRVKKAFAFLFVASCGASHGLLDSLTSGGSGVAPWRPIEVSPFSAARFLTHRGLEVLGPAAAFAALLLALRGGRAAVPSTERISR